MENELSIGQPIPTAILTPTEIIAPTEPHAEPSHAEAAVEQMPPEAVSSASLITEMMFAPITFWASISASYFRLFDTAVPLPAAWQRNG